MGCSGSRSLQTLPVSQSTPSFDAVENDDWMVYAPAHNTCFQCGQSCTEDHYDDDIDGDGLTNSEELLYNSDPRDANSSNRPPSDINASNLTIVENSAIGTVIGEFNATDPDGDGNFTYSFAPPTFEGFSPLLWLDANDRSTIIGVSQISQWRDKSGNNFHANQSNVDAMPSLIEKNGISLIGFDGISDILEVGTILSVESSFDVFLVAQQESDLEDYPRMLSSSVTWENDWVAPNWYLGDFLSGGSSPRFTLKAFNRKFSAHKIENLGIAGRTSVNPNKFNGEIGEFIVLQNLSDFQRQKVHGYLAHKWGLLDDLAESGFAVSQGLVLYYPFNETGGSIVEDYSETLRHGMVIDADLNTEGKFTSGIGFDTIDPQNAKIDLDYNYQEKHFSSKLVGPAVGWVESLGYKANIKPNNQIATRAADYHCR